MTFLDLHRLYSLSIRKKLVKPLKYFKKEFKMKKAFVFHPSDLIIVVNLKIMFLKIFSMKMAFLTISLFL